MVRAGCSAGAPTIPEAGGSARIWGQLWRGRWRGGPWCGWGDLPEVGSGARLPDYSPAPSIYCLLPSASHLPSLCLSFLTCKME